MQRNAVTASPAQLIRVLALGATISVVSASAGLAQIGGVGLPGGQNQIGDRYRKAAPEKPSEPLVDAMPGAKAREPAAPATRAAGDLQPTDALFDAINRGDIASARDALNRGADLNGVNILGMTPMELSVDLGRNDISFLLLSMRGEDSGRGSRSVGRDSAGGAPENPRTGSTTKAARSVRPAAPPKVAQVAAKPLATPKLFANDGGTPLPSAGFLGFDSRSASN